MGLDPLANCLRLTRERPVKSLVSDSAESPRFMLRPDLCVHFDNQMLAILDTKWKRLLPDEQNAGVGQSDLYRIQGIPVNIVENDPGQK
ncbi:hypothetical protein [Burkholderia sp. S171]|uniref:5-methylcytosine restriction system specificity protein McrC n=1 Tax=Burkholderia sp. S171 TaxID=1641860 RepID=UPI00131B7995|nr:hypothetical protein [Burkholderia sp. S171]